MAETQTRGPEGSRFDQEQERRRSRSPKRRVKRAFTQALVWLAAWLAPPLYLAYCWFVESTSRREDELTPVLRGGMRRHDRFVALLWHREVVWVAFAYRHLQAHTLASAGNFGRVVTRLLEACNFQVFRGGSSTGKARRRRVLVPMIRHMQNEPRVCYGITVDGSQGPAFVMKPGGALIAKKCRAPVFLVASVFSRALTLPTWDRTQIPLPFGRILSLAIGPYWIDPQADEAEFTAFLEHLQAELLELYARAEARLLPPHVPPRASPGYPAEWQPRWTAGQLGSPRSEWDLQTETWPEWAHRPAPASERG